MPAKNGYQVVIPSLLATALSAIATIKITQPIKNIFSAIRSLIEVSKDLGLLRMRPRGDMGPTDMLLYLKVDRTSLLLEL